jgi:hypothetical protein
VVEGTSLENWHGRKSIVGSNPTLSANSSSDHCLIAPAIGGKEKPCRMRLPAGREVTTTGIKSLTHPS